MTTDPAVTSALSDLVRACRREGAAWTLIGGQSLISHGVPRHTEDANGLVDPGKLGDVCQSLVEVFGWTPLAYDPDTADYAEAREVTTHFMDDPILFDVGVERMMVPLRATMGLVVELLAAQHPVEARMVEESSPSSKLGVVVPVAPLGGVMLVKAKADRLKDVAALEQAAEHLDADAIRRALEWAEEADPATAADLRAILTAARTRRAPRHTSSYHRKK
jgi:hypothetical protein